MSTRTYLFRLIVPFTLMLVCVVGGSGALISYTGHQTARQQQADDLERFTALFAAQFAAGNDLAQVAASADLLDTRLTIIDDTGRVTFDNRADIANMDNHGNRPEVIDARRDGVGRSFRESRIFSTPFVYVARRLDDGRVVRAAYAQRPFARLDPQKWLLLSLGVVLAIALTSWLAIKLNRRVLSPVQKLALAAGRMAAGDWRARVEPGESGELRDFSGRLNDLARHAQQQLDELHHQQSDLSALVDSLPDPILLTDPKQRVVLINTPAERFLGISPKQAVGQKLLSLIADEQVAEVFEKLATDGDLKSHALQREIRVARNGQKMTYHAVAARTGAGGMLLVLRDVSRLASAVQMKTDFVANASHELRTPIAALKLAFETLQDVRADDPAATERCITIIDGHLRRLEEMLSDLLDLSRVENAELKPQLNETRAADVIATVRSTMAPLASDKGVTLHFCNQDDLVFNSDRRLLDLITKNLVENAVKFTPAGGTVTLSFAHEKAVLNASPAAAVLNVTDTGIGIPPQHVERVFERFYQVDAARSGSAGRGTGLGLAIVKHAAHALGGTVSIDSVIGRGTTVTCRFTDDTAPPDDEPAAITPTDAA